MLQDIFRRPMYIFIVDTDTYAGNFERELTAYCTGCVGECGVGDNHAVVFNEECPGVNMEAIIEMVPDENGCRRPTSIWPTPGFWNDGLGSEWPDSMWGSVEACRKYEESAKKHNVSAKVPMGRYPSYQSVAMFFCEQPSEEILKLLQERARKFEGVKPRILGVKPRFKILGFRLVRGEYKEEQIWSSGST